MQLHASSLLAFTQPQFFCLHNQSVRILALPELCMEQVLCADSSGNIALSSIRVHACAYGAQHMDDDHVQMLAHRHVCTQYGQSLGYPGLGPTL